MAKIPNTKNCNCLNNYGLKDEALLSVVKYDIQVAKKISLACSSPRFTLTAPPPQKKKKIISRIDYSTSVISIPPKNVSLKPVGQVKNRIH